MTFISSAGVRMWSEECLLRHWKLASYVASLPSDRWLQRVLNWRPEGFRSAGRPQKTWQEKLDSFCQAHDVGDWHIAAQDKKAWLEMADDFVAFAR